MHEMSVAMEICRIAESHLEPEERPRLTEVGLDVGRRAGLVVDNLEFCLEALLSSAPFGRAKPAVRRLEGDVLQVTYLEVDDDGPQD